MIEPRLIRREAIFGLDFVLGKSVEQPHAFVGIAETAEA
jgi:hypothetical protein